MAPRIEMKDDWKWGFVRWGWRCTVLPELVFQRYVEFQGQSKHEIKVFKMGGLEHVHGQGVEVLILEGAVGAEGSPEMQVAGESFKVLDWAGGSSRELHPEGWRW